jgi:hypothetical protein
MNLGVNISQLLVAENATEYTVRQTRKGKLEFRAPLGEVETPSEPFQVTAMDITGP